MHTKQVDKVLIEFDLDTGLSPCEPGRLRIKTYMAELERGEIVVYV